MADDRPFHNPFAALEKLRGSLPRNLGNPSETAAEPPAAAQSSTGKTFARAVVRLERTGRGGKEVTVVSHLDLPPKDREVWLKALKAALGCGGVVDDDTLVLQGDHRTRLPAILQARGVKKIAIG